MSSFFCDTSFFFASLVPVDPNHARAERFLVENKRALLFSTWEIVGETVTLLRYRAGFRLASRFLESVRPHLQLVPCDQTMREEAERVFRRFARDKRLSFCDCLSFVILSTHLTAVPVLTFDRDFKQFGFLPGIS